MDRREFLKLSARTMIATPFIVSDASGLESLLANSSQENITLEQHQEDLKYLINEYEDQIKKHHNGKYTDGQENLIEMIVPLDEEKDKIYGEWAEANIKFRKALKEKKDIASAIDDINKKFSMSYINDKYGPLKPTDFVNIKFDPNNIFYFRRDFEGQKMLYVKDVGTNSLQLYTKDFVRTDKDLEVDGFSFEGPKIDGKESEWKKTSEEFKQRYMREVHQIVKGIKDNKIHMYFWFADPKSIS